MEQVYKYCDDIRTGKIAACTEVKQAVQRFRDDLKRDDLVFNIDKANRAIKFISYLKHYSGRFAGKNFILEPWQEFIIANLFGWYNLDGSRRFTECYVEVSRKQGKTFLISAILLYGLLGGIENDPQILMAANSKEQANIGFETATKILKQTFGNRSKHYSVFRDMIKTSSGGYIKKVSKDTSTLDGYSPSMASIDEKHEARTLDMYNVIKSGMGIRGGLLAIITTAGFNKNSVCYNMRKVNKEILSGLKTDDSLFTIIYTLDPEDDYRDSSKWIKCAPNLNVTVPRSVYKGYIQQAINDVSKETGILTKNFNIWVDTLETWISHDTIMKNSKKLHFDYFEDFEIICGVDLSQTTDITAVSYMIEVDNKFHFINKYYLPEDSLNTLEMKEQYKLWSKQGYITLTPGNVVDYDYILHDMLELHKKNYIQKVAYDTYNATQWAINATEAGLNLEPYSQAIGNFNRPTKEYKRLMLSNQIVIDENPVTRWMFANVHLKMDHNGNEKPSKVQKDSMKKIDGIISMLQCLGVFLNDPQYSPAIY